LALKPAKASPIERGIVLSFPPRADFDRWLALGLDLDGYYRELLKALEPFEEGAPSPAEVREAKYLLFRRPAAELAEAVAAFMRGLAVYERDALYDASGAVRVEFVAAAVAVMLHANPRGSLSVSDDLTGLLVAEPIASGASATRLEYVARKLSRECAYAPGLSLILKTIDEARTPESSSAFDQDEDGTAIIWMRAELERAVAEAKPVRRLPGCVR
jgi:hypothetical protein